MPSVKQWLNNSHELPLGQTAGWMHSVIQMMQDKYQHRSIASDSGITGDMLLYTKDEIMLALLYYKTCSPLLSVRTMSSSAKSVYCKKQIGSVRKTGFCRLDSVDWQFNWTPYKILPVCYHWQSNFSITCWLDISEDFCDFFSERPLLAVSLPDC